MNKKLKLALATLLGFSAACSTVKNAPAKGEDVQHALLVPRDVHWRFRSLSPCQTGRRPKRFVGRSCPARPLDQGRGDVSGLPQFLA